MEIYDEVLTDLYAWVDMIPLSRKKKNIVRDFSDGVLAAEIVKHYFPSRVDLNNFPQTMSSKQKRVNWGQLNNKVFRKILGFELSDDVINNVIESKPGTIERILLLIRSKLDKRLFQEKQKQAALEGNHFEGGDDGGGGGATHMYDDSMLPQQHHPQQGGGNLSNRKMHAQQQQQPMMNAYASVGQSDSANATGGGGGQVSRLRYEEKVQDTLAKQETIEILQAKIRRLEHLLQLKDARIDSLTARLAELRPTGR